MGRFTHLVGDLFWSAVMVLVALAVAVFILRIMQSRGGSIGATVASTVSHATGIDA